MGFTPLHYATVARKKDAVLLLLAEGASAAAESLVSFCFADSF
jgi:ankyrin repeat protein